MWPEEDKTADVDDANGRRRVAAVGVIVELNKADAERWRMLYRADDDITIIFALVSELLVPAAAARRAAATARGTRSIGLRVDCDGRGI